MQIRRCLKCMHSLQLGESSCPVCGWEYGRATAAAFALKPGTILDGKYLVGEMLGQGGFGITYIGFDLLLEQKVAIKEYFPMSTGMVSRDNQTTVVWSDTMMHKTGVEKGFDSFLKEARKMARLGGIPGVVGVKSVFIQNETAYIVMDFVEGETLLKKLQREGPMEFDRCVSLLRPILEALAKVHKQGIIHRDISPDNIMVQPDGQLILLDLGAAKDLELQQEDGSIRSSQLVAKHGFSPAEQYRTGGNIGSWTDVYAMAATIYYCCTGTVPPAALDRVFEETLMQKPLLTKEQFDSLSEAMAIMPEKRTQDMKSLLSLLNGKTSKSRTIKPQPPENKSEQPETRESKQTKEKTKKWHKKWPLTLVAVLLCAVTVGLLGKTTKTPNVRENPPTQLEDPVTVQTVPAPTSTEATQPQFVVDEEVELTMIAAQYTNQTADWWANFVSEFNAENPNINLVVDVVSWNDIYTVVNNRIANYDAPDLLNIDVFADYQADGLLLPVEKWVSPKTYAKFYPEFLKQSTIANKVWALPDLTSTRALYYNADILEAVGVPVPTTWEEVRAAAAAIKAYNSKIYPWGVDMTTNEGQACFAYYTMNNGGGFTDAAGNWALNSAENVEAVEFIVSMVKQGLTNPDPITQTRYDLQDMFASGKVAMMIGPDTISNYCEQNSSINYGVAPIPTNGNKSGSSLAVLDRIMCFDNDYTDAELAAITILMDAFYEDESYAEWVLMEGFLPATSTANELCAMADPSAAVWGDILQSAKFYPADRDKWVDVKQGVISVLQEALLGGNVQKLLNELQAEITS